MLSVEGRRKGGDRQRERDGVILLSQREAQTRRTGISKNVLGRCRDVNRQEMGKVTCGLIVINEHDHLVIMHALPSNWIRHYFILSPSGAYNA